MKNLIAFCLVLPLPGLHADVTLRYTSTNQFTSLPPAIMDQVMKQRGVQMPDAFSVRLKGTRGYSKIGNLEFITDLAAQQATLLDREGKRYATAPLKEVASRFAAALPRMASNAQKMLGAMKGDFHARKTGRTEVILGIDAEETEGVLTVGGAAPVMKMIIQFWTAKPAAAQRIASLREFTAYSQKSSAFLSPADLIRQMTGRIAGFAQGIGSMIDEIQKSQSVMLKAHMEMQMPLLTRMAAQAAKKDGEEAETVDPDKPFVTIDQNLVEISDAPIDDSVFGVPKGYQPASMEELVKAILPPSPE